MGSVGSSVDHMCVWGLAPGMSSRVSDWGAEFVGVPRTSTERGDKEAGTKRQACYEDCTGFRLRSRRGLFLLEWRHLARIPTSIGAIFIAMEPIVGGPERSIDRAQKRDGEGGGQEGRRNWPACPPLGYPLRRVLESPLDLARQAQVAEWAGHASAQALLAISNGITVRWTLLFDGEERPFGVVHINALGQLQRLPEAALVGLASLWEAPQRREGGVSGRCRKPRLNTLWLKPFALNPRPVARCPCACTAICLDAPLPRLGLDTL